MDLSKILTGPNPPDDVNVVIEVARHFWDRRHPVTVAEAD